MYTKRLSESSILSDEERSEFIKHIRNLPWMYEPMLKTLESYATECSTLIDVACGDGYLLFLISKKFPHLKLIGLDLDKKMLCEARSKYPFTFYIMNAHSLNQCYDLVICNHSWHHIHNPEKLLEKLYTYSLKYLIVADQVRPATEKELLVRMERRSMILGNKESTFYEKHERESALGTFSLDEIKKLIDMFPFPPISFQTFDNDYYERFVVVFNKK